ncbi:hypothetical protein AMTR_s00044p00231890 [Amborella trichopoda]|uniref:Uncharacterized protein n=1 Tax=Amborella trichopoda TaxID=13333 RepID=U5D4Y7_AMBTC|nr:hypothetical protein AMTR_s00044p00231890 [Amborella trichopoda]
MESMKQFGQIFSVCLWLKLKDPPYSQVLVVIEVADVSGAMVEAEVVDVAVWNPTSDEKDKFKCTHCGKSPHTRETCWGSGWMLKAKLSKPNSTTISERSALVT